MPMTKFPGAYLAYKIIISHEAWRTYRTKHPDGLDYWSFRRLLSDVSDGIIDEVFTNPQGFLLPDKFGVLRMIGFKMKKTTERRKLHRIEYARTNNYIYQLIWLKHSRKVKVKNLNFFKLHTARLIKNRIHKAIKNDEFFDWIKLNSKKDVKNMTEY